MSIPPHSNPIARRGGGYHGVGGRLHHAGPGRRVFPQVSSPGLKQGSLIIHSGCVFSTPGPAGGGFCFLGRPNSPPPHIEIYPRGRGGGGGGGERHYISYNKEVNLLGYNKELQTPSLVTIYIDWCIPVQNEGSDSVFCTRPTTGTE